MTRRPRRLAATLLALGGAMLVAAGVAAAAFTSTTASPGNQVTAAPDFRAPTASSSAIVRTGGNVAGYVKKAGTYFVYANVADTGNPASGVATVTADVSQLTPGTAAAPLTAGSYTAAGVTYNYRSASLTGSPAVAEGAKTYSLTLTDVAGNAATQSGFGVVYDNTPPTGVDVQTTNGGGPLGVGAAGQGDTIVYTFSEPIDPTTVLAGWNGSATNVAVRLLNGTLIPTTNERILVYDATDTTQLALGSIDLGRDDYVLLGDTKFGTAGSPSTMVMSSNTITVTLGALNGLGINLGAGNGTMLWTPSASALDRAGNVTSTAGVTESGAADREF